MDFENRRDEILNKLHEEYDLSDLAENDKMLLEELASALAQATSYNEVLSEELTKLREGETGSLNTIKSLQRLLTDSRKDASNLSDDLKISRKSREKDNESVPDYIKSLKDRAKHFVDQRLSYVYCPKCKVLNATLWLLNYTSGSKFGFVCPKCNNRFFVRDAELKKRKNIKDVVVPQSPD